MALGHLRTPRRLGKTFIPFLLQKSAWRETPCVCCALQIYTALRNRIVSAQPPDRQAHLSLCLDKLMADVQRNLEPKNREKFTQVGRTASDLPHCCISG